MRIAVAAVYAPPEMTVDDAESLQDFIFQSVLKIKDKVRNCQVVVGGDLNHVDLDVLLACNGMQRGSKQCVRRIQCSCGWVGSGRRRIFVHRQKH